MPDHDKHPAAALAFEPLSLRGADWHDSADELLRRIPALEAECVALRAEVQALREDAERYRWLRTFPNNIAPSVYGWTMVAGSGLLRRDTYLDKAIDASRKQQ